MNKVERASDSTVYVDFLDTTLRDGAQSLPYDKQFPDGSKAAIAESIASLGIGTIEAGFPATPEDGREVKNVARTIGRGIFKVYNWSNDGLEPKETHFSPSIAGLCRANPSDIEITWGSIKEAKRPRIHTFIPTDFDHIKAKFPDKSPDDILDLVTRAVILSRELADSHIKGMGAVEVSAEAASTTDMEFLERFVKSVIDAGVDVINLPDTTGQTSTLRMQIFYKKVLNWVMKLNPKVVVSAHNHNDLGLAASNSQALIDAACVHASINDTDVNIQVETTICGVGERAGNTDIFSLAGQIFKFSNQYPCRVEWSFNPGQSVSVANYVLNKASLEVNRQNPIVGSDINVHRSGIHSDGIIKGGHRIYTPFDPTFWGHIQDAVHQDGKYQGNNGRKNITSSVN